MAVTPGAMIGSVGGSALAGALGGSIFGPLGTFLGLLGGAIVGMITVGQMQEQDAAAEAARIEAENLQELSQEGGYYDQVREAIQTELDDIEADRAASATNLSMTLAELESQTGVSKLQESAAVAGQAAQGLETARAGAEGEGQIKAAAGAGGVSVGSGSVLRIAASIGRAISRRVAVTNLGISATRLRGEAERNIIRNNMVRAQLDYENVIRGEDTREAQTLANQTLTEFQQETGIERAELLESQAEWMQGPGMFFTALGGVLDAASTGISLGSRFDGRTTPGTTPSSSYDFTSGGGGAGYGPSSANPFAWSISGATNRPVALTPGSY